MAEVVERRSRSGKKTINGEEDEDEDGDGDDVVMRMMALSIVMMMLALCGWQPSELRWFHTLPLTNFHWM